MRRVDRAFRSSTLNSGAGTRSSRTCQRRTIARTSACASTFQHSCYVSGLVTFGKGAQRIATHPQWQRGCGTHHAQAHRCPSHP
eukprot:2446762-Amphidinium_carterae.1